MELEGSRSTSGRPSVDPPLLAKSCLGTRKAGRGFEPPCLCWLAWVALEPRHSSASRALQRSMRNTIVFGRFSTLPGVERAFPCRVRISEGS